MDTRKHILDLEAFKEMLHISPRILSQSFAELPFEEEILEFLSLPSLEETELIGITSGMMYRSLQSRWYRDTRLLNNTVRYYLLSSLLTTSGTTRLIRSTMLVLLERQHQNQRRVPKKRNVVLLHPPLLLLHATPTPTTTVVAAPRLSAAAKGKQPARVTTLTEPTDVERTEAEQLKIALKRSRQEMHISQQRGSGTDEGTGSKPGVP
nr:hypothetical protein [Tanacetum cinerariifolium]